MSEMVSSPKPHPEETSELKVTVRPYLAFSLDDLALHQTINVFYQAVPFQQSFNDFPEVFCEEKSVQ